MDGNTDFPGDRSKPHSVCQNWNIPLYNDIFGSVGYLAIDLDVGCVRRKP